MSDPERLLNGIGAEHALERSVLGSLRSVPVPPRARRLVWGALSARGVAAAALTSSAAAAAPMWRVAPQALTPSKAALALPVLVSAMAVGALRQHGAPAVPVATLSAAAPAARPAPAAAPVVALAPVAAEPATESLPERPSPSPRTDRLREESTLLTRARAALRSGDPSAAQALLARAHKEFASGALVQEREVLTIETAAAQGNASAADRLARAFIAAHPESPHAQPLRRFVTAP